MNLAERIEAMWWHEGKPPLILRGIGRIYAAINRYNLDKRARACVQPPVPMISVGNITVGGSGKTPFVIWLCNELKARGYRPVVLCRGDGGSLREPRRVLPGDAADRVGDEALLLALRSGAPVVAGRDRVAGARLAATLGDVIVLDDGFQYRQLGRSCDLVLLPAVGIGNGHLLPAGPLRELPEALGRADLIVRTGGESTAPLSDGHEWHWHAEAESIRPLCGGHVPATAPWLAVAGIARAERFFVTAANAVNVRQEMRFADHFRYTAADVARMLEPGLPVLTTEKDAVKLLPLWPQETPLYVLPLAGHGEEGLPETIIKTMLSHRKN